MCQFIIVVIKQRFEKRLGNKRGKQTRRCCCLMVRPTTRDSNDKRGMRQIVKHPETYLHYIFIFFLCNILLLLLNLCYSCHCILFFVCSVVVAVALSFVRCVDVCGGCVVLCVVLCVRKEECTVLARKTDILNRGY